MAPPQGQEEERVKEQSKLSVIQLKCLLKTKYDQCIMYKDVVEEAWITVMAALGQSCENLLAGLHLESFSFLTFGSQEGISSGYEPLMMEHLPCVQAEVLSLSRRRVGIRLCSPYYTVHIIQHHLGDIRTLSRRNTNKGSSVGKFGLYDTNSSINRSLTLSAVLASAYAATSYHSKIHQLSAFPK